MSDNFKREAAGSVELAEHFKQSGSPRPSAFGLANYFK